eukprot:scaffold53108_cov36-Phaeocystis_antarctica.AAC.1
MSIHARPSFEASGGCAHQQVGRLSSGSWKISEPLHPWTSRRRSSDSRKVTARLDKKLCPADQHSQRPSWQ